MPCQVSRSNNNLKCMTHDRSWCIIKFPTIDSQNTPKWSKKIENTNRVCHTFALCDVFTTWCHHKGNRTQNFAASETTGEQSKRVECLHEVGRIQFWPEPRTFLAAAAPSPILSVVLASSP